MKIDCSPLEKAFEQLRKSHGYLHSDLARSDEGLREQFRSASIQAFEFTYAVAIDMIRRQLAQIVDNPAELPRVNFNDVMRDAADAGIIRDAQIYMKYRVRRNKSSHVYNGEIAENVEAILDEFIGEISFLLERLRERNRATD